MSKKGDRVGAICGSTKKGIEFFGYGVYQGQEVPPKGIEFMGIDMSEHKMPNPKILLDNGDIVWGCQCWWGSEEEVRKRLEGKNIINISIKEALERSESK